MVHAMRQAVEICGRDVLVGRRGHVVEPLAACVLVLHKAVFREWNSGWLRKQTIVVCSSIRSQDTAVCNDLRDRMPIVLCAVVV